MKIRSVKKLSIYCFGCCLFCYSNLTNTTAMHSARPTQNIFGSTIRQNGFTINSPGYYLVGEDLIFTSTMASKAIIINSNLVTIDLGGKSLYQTAAEMPGEIGIEIAPNIHDIVIRNGSIANFSDSDIYVGANCYHIAFDDLQIIGSNVPMHFAGSSGSEIFDCYISDCILVNGATCGLCLNYCDSFEISGCNFIRNYNYGAHLTNCSECEFTNCGFDHTISTSSSHGIMAETTKNLLFNKCTFNSNTATEACYGLYLDSSTGSEIKECRANGNNSSNNYPCAAIYILNGKGNILESCITSGNSAEDGSCYGITIKNCRGCRILNSTSLAQTTTSANEEAVGILLDAGSYNAVIGCTTEDIENTGVAENGIGMKITSSESSSLIKNCYSFSNTGTGIINNSSSSMIVGCIAGGNGISNYGGDISPTFTSINKEGASTSLKEFENVELF